MKRAILILAATGLLGATGCGRCDRETLTVNWTFIDGAGNTQSCDNSGTVSMQIRLNGDVVTDDLGNTSFSCADFPNSIPLSGVLSGVNDVEFDAFDINGQSITQQFQTVNVNRCGNTTAPQIQATMTQAPLVIDYFFTPGLTCLNTDVIWYVLTDPRGVTFVVDNTSNSNLVVTCGSQVAFSTAPFGNYQLTAIEIVDNRNPTNPVPIATNCSPQPAVNHLGFDSVAVTLGPANGVFCF